MDMHDHGHVAAVHNMALVGGRRVFLSHLPMFMSPHDAQVIVEAKFVKDGKNADALYVADHASNPRPVALLGDRPRSAPRRDPAM